jgi:acyl-coenzyme A synthetase/AMP-(fatty) acid ligase
MKALPRLMTSIRDKLADAPDCSGRFLWGATASIPLGGLLRGTSLGGHLAELSGRSVLVATREQGAAAAALIELDGVARRLIICTPDLSSEHRDSVIALAGVDAIVSDHDQQDWGGRGIRVRVICSSDITPTPDVRVDRIPTEWVLLTSGTTGEPKMVVHTLASLTAPIASGQNEGPDVVWGTFYDIRRYGGLQIFLRGVLGRGSFVLSSSAESPGDYLLRLGAHGVTHISGTPSHWRRALMSPLAHQIAPRYVRLSGEIADQAILDHLRAFYPEARIAHAFASTEAGVAFDVGDGLAGFPASLIGQRGADVEMKVGDGSLQIRSARTAAHYLGGVDETVADRDGFVDTGDMVERRGDRYYFVGRRGGIINVGGQKVHPEEVEAVINDHPKVRMSLVRARKNPITGALVVADVVLKTEPDAANEEVAEIKREILQLCRTALSQHKVPTAINVVPALAVAATGKMVRRDA